VRQANEADPFVLKIELIKEADGTWIPLMCITSDLSMQEIIASYGIRFGIEEVFKDLKETYWLGQTGCPKFMDVC
jgi:hypothetical protein